MKHSVLCVLAALACGACANGGASSQGRRIGTGLVVEYGLAHSGVEPKAGLQAMSDKGARLFGGMMEGWYGGASTNSYIAGHLPGTVRVTWRTDTVPGQRFTTGRVIGDYLIEVDKRVPDEVIRYANAGPGRALRLVFRIKDDGVLFGWDVEEVVSHPAGGSGLVYAMRGGDVPCYDLPRAANASQNCTEGPLEKAAWFNPQWIRGRKSGRG